MMCSQEDFDVNELEQLFSAVVRKPNDGSKSEKQKSAGSKNDKVHLVPMLIWIHIQVVIHL